MEIEQLYEAFRPKVFGYLYSRLNHYHDAEDLSESVFLKVCAKWDSFDASRASASTWIYVITRNVLTDYYRTHKVNADLDEIDELPYEGGEPLETLINAEAQEQLAAALEKLDERERDLILLRYDSGRTLAEIACLFGLSYPQIKRMHKKALGKLQAYLA